MQYNKIISYAKINISLGLVGLTDINEVNDEVISKKYFKNMKYWLCYLLIEILWKN